MPGSVTDSLGVTLAVVNDCMNVQTMMQDIMHTVGLHAPGQSLICISYNSLCPVSCISGRHSLVQHLYSMVNVWGIVVLQSLHKHT